MNYAIIEINGGIGKSVMATAVVAAIKEKHPDRNIVVVTGYPEIFIGNPDVYRVYRHGCTPYFWNNYIQGKDTLFFSNEPYTSHGYLSQTKHLIESWTESMNLPCPIKQGKLFVNSAEFNFVKNRIAINKPLLVFQPFGGHSQQEFKYNWNRDIPPHQAQLIANILSEKYHIVQPIHNNQIKLNNCEHISLPLRDLIALTSLCKKFVGIDSCLQHIAACLGISGTVCWVTNSPVVFGYDLHINVMPDSDNYSIVANTLIDGYTHLYNFAGTRKHDYPFKNENVFNVTEIIESVG